jgi:hypothetical protein
MGHDPSMKSRVHPKYKTKYRMSNWTEYDRALVQRGEITLWISEGRKRSLRVIASWQPAPSGKGGAQRKFSDHTTLSRRKQRLDVALHLTSTKKPIHLIVDSTGLSIAGEGEWAAARHGGRGKRAWKKLHVGVDRSGLIVAEALTHGNADDAKTALDLIAEMEGEITSIRAARQRSWRSTCESKIRRDAAYDTTAIYDARAARGAEVVVPPAKSATRTRRRRSRSSARDRTIMRVKEIGRRQWKKESGYHRQARVENTFFRYKTTIGSELRARHPQAQEAEVVMACNILNRMTGLGRPACFAIGA